VSTRWRIPLTLAISAVALALAFRHVALADLARAVASARPLWLLPAFACFVVLFSTRACRWALLMGGTPFWTTLLALCIGYMLNDTLPLKAGEIGRAVVIGRKTGIGVTRALSSIVVERVLDLAAMVLMFVVLARLVPMPHGLARAASFASIVLVATVAIGGFLLWTFQGDSAPSWLARLGARGERWWARARDARDGLRGIGPRRLALVLMLTAVVWAATILLAELAMGAFLPPDGTAAAMVVVASNLGGALPSAPGGFGVIQGFAKEALVVPFHVAEDRALAYVFVWSLGQQILLVLAGLGALSKLGISLGQARRAASTAAPDVE
jgi:uncharacterized protein (TIRG00374 family)